MTGAWRLSDSKCTLCHPGSYSSAAGEQIQKTLCISNSKVGSSVSFNASGLFVNETRDVLDELYSVIVKLKYCLFRQGHQLALYALLEVMLKKVNTTT
jgi:hypothetical protein